MTEYKFLMAVLALREVAEFLAGQTLTVDVETVSFAQHFPRSVLFLHTKKVSCILFSGKLFPARISLNP